MFTSKSIVAALSGSIFGAMTAAAFTFAVAASPAAHAPSSHSATYSADGTSPEGDGVGNVYPDDSGWD
jgi:hypothetical protein